jgi:hypothetical protein
MQMHALCMIVRVDARAFRALPESSPHWHLPLEIFFAPAVESGRRHAESNANRANRRCGDSRMAFAMRIVRTAASLVRHDRRTWKEGPRRSSRTLLAFCTSCSSQRQCCAAPKRDDQQREQRLEASEDAVRASKSRVRHAMQSAKGRVMLPDTRQRAPARSGATQI